MDEVSVYERIRRRDIPNENTLYAVAMGTHFPALPPNTVYDCWRTAQKLALPGSLQSLWETYTMLAELVLRAQGEG